MKQLFATRYVLGVLVLCFLTGIVRAQTSPATFAYTGAVQTFTVPAGVTSLNVVANGGQGGSDAFFAGGKGGRVTATLTVTPGQSLSLYVGGVPFNGGGAGGTINGGAGGGATDIRIGGTALSNRILVAGGGGASDGGPGGSGGGLTAGAGSGGGGGGGGGSQSAGGATDANSAVFTTGGTAGTAGSGGNGWGDAGDAAGGGGGGYYGGGGGGFTTSTSGGGGGSSYTDPSLVTSVVHEQGVNTGNGSMTLNWVNVLSVELLDFKATPLQRSPIGQYNGNLLTWTTANEVNNKGFNVERLMENPEHSGWITLGFVNAKSKAASYDFTDNTPLSAGSSLNSTSYYRLRQIDNDGTETLSKVVSIANKGNNKLALYPNPVSNVLTVERNAVPFTNDDFQIFNLLGQQVLTGQAAQRIDVSALPQGTYFLKVGAEQVKFMKQ